MRRRLEGERAEVIDQQVKHKCTQIVAKRGLRGGERQSLFLSLSLIFTHRSVHTDNCQSEFEGNGREGEEEERRRYERGQGGNQRATGIIDPFLLFEIVLHY